MLRHGAATTEWEGPFPGTFSREGDEEYQLEWRGEAVTDYIPGGSTPSAMQQYPHHEPYDTRPPAIGPPATQAASAQDPPAAARPRPPAAVQIVAGPKEALERHDLRRLLRSDTDFTDVP